MTKKTAKATTKKPRGRSAKKRPADVVPIGSVATDADNACVHSDRNLALIGNSLAEFGAGRSILIDGDGIVRAGNGTVEAAKAAGIKTIRIIESDGSELIAVRRSDLKGTRAKAAGIADNRSSDLHSYDIEKLQQQVDDITAQLDIDPADFALSRNDLDALLADINSRVGEFVSEDGTESQEHRTLAERFVVPPFSVLDARQGYWQERKRAWLALGIHSELGRGGGLTHGCDATSDVGVIQRERRCANATPGGSLMPAANYSKTKARGDGKGRPIK